MSSEAACKICHSSQDHGYRCMNQHTLCGPCSGISQPTPQLLDCNDCRICQRDYLDPQHTAREVPALFKKFSALKNAVGTTQSFCSVNRHHGIGTVRAKKLCTECGVYSCEKCLSTHTDSGGRHSICDLVSSRRHDSTVCRECSHRKPSFFCLTEDCCSALCDVCKLCHDGDHDVQSMSDASEVMTDYIQTKEHSLKNSWLYMEEKKLDIGRERRGELREMARIREKINSWADELLNIVEKQRADILNDLRKKEEEVNLEFDHIEKKLMQAEDSKFHLKRIHDLIEDSNVCDVMSVFDFIKANENRWKVDDVRRLTESGEKVHFREIVYRRQDETLSILKNNNLFGQIFSFVNFHAEPIAVASLKCDTDAEEPRVSNILVPKPKSVIACDLANKVLKTSKLQFVNGKHAFDRFKMKAQHISQIVHDRNRGRLIAGVCNGASWFDEVWQLSEDFSKQKRLCRIKDEHAGLLLVASENYAFVITVCRKTNGQLHSDPEDLQRSGEISLSPLTPRRPLSPLPKTRSALSPLGSPRRSGYNSPNCPSSPSPLSKSAEFFPNALNHRLRRIQLDHEPGQLSPKRGNSPRVRRKRCDTCPSDILNSQSHDNKDSPDLKRKWRGEIFMHDLDTFDQIRSVATDFCPHSAVATPNGELVMVSRDGWMRVLTPGLEEIRSVRIAGIRGYQEADFHASSATALAVNSRGQLLMGMHGVNVTSDQRGGRVNLYSMSGEYLRTLISETAGLSHPTAAAMDDHGKFYVADGDREQRLVVFRPERSEAVNRKTKKDL